MLPKLGFGALIREKPAELHRHRPLAALRTEPQVDLVEASAPGRHGERGDHPLGEAGVVDHGIEAAWPRALALGLVEVVDHHEIEVRSGRQLARAEPAESENRDTAARNDAVLG